MNRIPIRRLVTSAAVAALLAPLAASAQGGGTAQPSLYDRLGGLAPISVVVNDFIDALVPDAQINANPAVDAARKRVPASYLKFHVTSMVCQATGGPCQYAGRSMKDSHTHLQITAKEWDRMVEVLVQILDRYGVPEAEQQELLAIVDSTKADIVMRSGA